jgi:hypothetical protein
MHQGLTDILTTSLDSVTQAARVYNVEDEVAGIICQAILTPSCDSIQLKKGALQCGG